MCLSTIVRDRTWPQGRLGGFLLEDWPDGRVLHPEYM